MALVDERGCRRDIRSNGWIDFRKGSLFQNRSGRRNKFSSFGAESLLRNFIGPKARLKSGPDVFADALVPRNVPVPRNVSRSPERFAFRLPRLRCRAFRSFQILYMPVPIARGPWPGCRRSRSCPRPVAARFANPSLELLQSTGSSVCADDDARETRDVAMVIVVRNGRVNRTSRLLTCCCGTGTSAIPHRSAREARLHPVHRDTLNCPSNLIGHDHPNKPANGVRE